MTKRGQARPSLDHQISVHDDIIVNDHGHEAGDAAATPDPPTHDGGELGWWRLHGVARDAAEESARRRMFETALEILDGVSLPVQQK